MVTRAELVVENLKIVAHLVCHGLLWLVAYFSLPLLPSPHLNHVMGQYFRVVDFDLLEGLYGMGKLGDVEFRPIPEHSGLPRNVPEHSGTLSTSAYSAFCSISRISTLITHLFGTF